MFPYVVDVVQDYLAGELPSVRVATKVPKERPNRLVIITTVPAGPSQKPRYLSTRRVVLQCWDTTESAAGNLAETVRDLMLEAPFEHIGIRRTTVVGEPARFDDATSNTPRFQLTVDLLLRANPQ